MAALDAHGHEVPTSTHTQKKVTRSGWGVGESCEMREKCARNMVGPHFVMLCVFFGKVAEPLSGVT